MKKIRKCGVIAITGFPNAGKSTLINSFVDSKISIVSHKVQTTKEAIKGIINIKNNQLVFIDTPGIVKTRKHFDKKLSRSIQENENMCDLNLFILDANKKNNQKDFELAKQLIKIFKKNILVINKIDLIQKEHLLVLSKKINEELNFINTFMISAKKIKNVNYLLKEILKIIPERDWLFKKNEVTDKSKIFQMSEITREKIFQLINKEIPYSIKVETLSKKRKNIFIVDQTIFVQKDSHKSIVIGKLGEKIKEIGSRARPEIEKILSSKVLLRINVLKKK